MKSQYKHETMTHQHQEILDTDPAVSMSIDIGKDLQPGEVVDVDYEALRQTLAHTGAPTNNSRSSIHFATKMKSGVRGHHQPVSRQTVVGFNRDRQEDMQRTLQHELTHYSDIMDNPVTESENRKYAIGQVSMRLVNYLLPAALTIDAASAASVVPGVKSGLSPSVMSEETYEATKNVIESAYFGSNAVLLGAVALSGAFYWANKRERLARKGGRKELPRVLSVNKEESDSSDTPTAVAAEPGRVVQRTAKTRPGSRSFVSKHRRAATKAA